MKLFIRKNNGFIFTEKFAIRVAALCSIFIIAQAVIFYFTISSNSKTLRATVIQSSNNILLDKAKLISSRMHVQKPQNIEKAIALLRSIALDYDDALYIVLFSPTEDENYFKISAGIPVNSDLHIDLKKNIPIKEESENSPLKKGRTRPEADPQVHSKDSYMWQNIYVPVSISEKSYIALFMFRASTLVRITDAFNSTTKHSSIIMLISSALLILGITLLTLIFIQSHSMLVKKLTLYMRKAAEGDLALNIKAAGDKELDSLAESFNTLIEEIKNIKTAPAEENTPEPQKHDDETPLLLKGLFKKGVSLLKEQHASEALVIFEFVISEAPFNFGAYFNSGVALVKLGKYDESIAMFYKAREINPSNELTEKYIHRIEKIIKNHA